MYLILTNLVVRKKLFVIRLHKIDFILCTKPGISLEKTCD